MSDSRQAVERARKLIDPRDGWPGSKAWYQEVVEPLARDVLALAAALADIERERDAAVRWLKLANDERAEFEAALHALATTYEHYACENDPETPCMDAPDLMWPDDWCLPCYTRETVRAALAAAEPKGQTP